MVMKKVEKLCLLVRNRKNRVTLTAAMASSVSRFRLKVGRAEPTSTPATVPKMR